MTKNTKLGWAGISILTFATLMSGPVVSATESITEVLGVNRGSDFHVTQIHEGINMIKAAWDMDVGWDPTNRSYQLTDYHIFWGEVSDAELPAALERTDVTTIAKGLDGETKFASPYAQVELTAPEGVNLADNIEKTIAYVVKLEARKPGLTDRIIAGRVDYSRCTNSIGYDAGAGAFCARDEYADGESFYGAYDQNWKKLKPSPEVEYIEKEVEVPTVVEKIVEKIVEKEVPVEVAKEVVKERLRTEVREVLEPFGIPVPVIANNDSVVKNTDTGAGSGVELQAGDSQTTDSVASSEGVPTTDVPDVPELGGPKQSSASGLLWWLGLSGMIAIGAVGALFWFILPMIAPRRRHYEKSNKKRK